MTILQALTLAFQFVNQPISDLALAEMADELAAYPVPSVLAALKRCRSELKSIRYADILDRLPGGHPGPEEAWALVRTVMQNEARTVVWTEQMRTAYGSVAGYGSDLVGARLAFKEAYEKLVSQARASRQTPVWAVSLGTDLADRERAIQAGVNEGKLLPTFAAKFLPYLGETLPDPRLALPAAKGMR